MKHLILFENLNWEPLEEWLKSIFGEERYLKAIKQWMLMQTDIIDGEQYYFYKNGITRRYLVLGEDSLPYTRMGNDKMVRISNKEAFQNGYLNIEKMVGVDVDEPWLTPYDCDYMCKRNQALKNAGFNVLTIKDIEKEIDKLDFLNK